MIHYVRRKTDLESFFYLRCKIWMFDIWLIEPFQVEFCRHGRNLCMRVLANDRSIKSNFVVMIHSNIIICKNITNINIKTWFNIISPAIFFDGQNFALYQLLLLAYQIFGSDYSFKDSHCFGIIIKPRNISQAKSCFRDWFLLLASSWHFIESEKLF